MKKKAKSKDNVSDKIDNLVSVVKVGFEKVDKKFESVDKQIDNLAISVKKGFDEADKNLKDFRVEVNVRFNKVETRLDRIENILVTGHENRIERLEDKVRVLETHHSRK